MLPALNVSVPSRHSARDARMQGIVWSMALAGQMAHARRHFPYSIQMTEHARAQFMIPTIHALMEHIINLLVNPTGPVAKLVMLVRTWLNLIMNLGYHCLYRGSKDRT